MYDIEIRIASKNGWMTPDESRAWYKDYARKGIAWHWWNSPDLVKDSDHDNIANYILGKAQRGTGSINYVVSNRKITLLVNPDMVSWHIAKKKKPFPNATEIGVELSPHLNAEGYKKAGWLKWQLEERYGRKLRDTGHKDWLETQCPGNVDIKRIVTEYNKWKRGDYDPRPPQPKPPKPEEQVPLNHRFTLWKDGDVYVPNKDTIWLHDLSNAKDWGSVKKIKPYKKGEKIQIVGSFWNTALNREYYITNYSFLKKSPTGFHPADLDVYVPPRPTPKPPEESPDIPETQEPTQPIPVPEDTGQDGEIDPPTQPEEPTLPPPEPQPEVNKAKVFFQSIIDAFMRIINRLKR